MSPDLARELLEHLRERTGEMVDFVARLARLESPSLDPASQEPVFALLGEELGTAGLRVRRRRGRASGGLLWASPRRRERGRPAQLLLGHCDTVWPVGTLAGMPVERSGGTLRGPGVFDMKGGLAQAVFALRALAALGVDPPLAPVVLVTSDEEVGSPESTPAIRRLARRMARVFVLEPALGPEGRLKTERKGVGRFTVTAHGRAAHAGLDPGRGVSAVLELAHAVLALDALNDPARGTTVNVGVVAGGTRANVVAAEARAEVDVRIARAEDGPGLERAVRGLEPTLPGARLEVSGGIDRPPLERTPGNRTLWRLARECGSLLGIELTEGSAGGGSDGNTTSLYAPTLDGLGAVGDGAHAAGEHLLVDRLPERAALLALLLLAPPS